MKLTLYYQRRGHPVGFAVRNLNVAVPSSHISSCNRLAVRFESSNDLTSYKSRSHGESCICTLGRLSDTMPPLLPAASVYTGVSLSDTQSANAEASSLLAANPFRLLPDKVMVS